MSRMYLENMSCHLGHLHAVMQPRDPACFANYKRLVDGSIESSNSIRIRFYPCGPWCLQIVLVPQSMAFHLVASEIEDLEIVKGSNPRGMTWARTIYPYPGNYKKSR